MSAAPRRPSRLGRAVAGCALACALASCATYPQRTAAALADFERGHLDAARRAFAEPSTTGSAFLSGAEAGMVALAAGDWQSAEEHLQRAAAVSRDIEERALLSPDALGESLVNLALSERASAYKGEGYERVLVHASLALAYLAQGSLDDVFVEVRRANRLLEGEERLYEKEYAAGGLGHFVSALTYELLDRPDEAYIDYRRMQAKGVGTELAGRALVRLAARLHFEEDLRRWEELYGPDVERPEGAASVVLIAGRGLAPQKQETTVTVPTPDGLVQWSVPNYVPRWQGEGSLILRSAGQGPGVRASTVEDVAKVAGENLDHRIGWLAARSAVRAGLKLTLTHQLEHKYDLVGRIAGDVLTFVTERADLRSWLTLPAKWSAARLFVEPGEHELVVEAEDGESRALGRFRLEPGETMIVLARTLRGRVHAHAIGGLALRAASERDGIPSAAPRSEPPEPGSP
jgi:hypothetical protein